MKRPIAMISLALGPFGAQPWPLFTYPHNRTATKHTSTTHRSGGAALWAVSVCTKLLHVFSAGVCSKCLLDGPLIYIFFWKKAFNWFPRRFQALSGSVRTCSTLAVLLWFSVMPATTSTLLNCVCLMFHSNVTVTRNGVRSMDRRGDDTAGKEHQRTDAQPELLREKKGSTS
jgi:hypothetical protein